VHASHILMPICSFLPSPIPLRRGMIRQQLKHLINLLIGLIGSNTGCNPVMLCEGKRRDHRPVTAAFASMTSGQPFQPRAFNLYRGIVIHQPYNLCVLHSVRWYDSMVAVRARWGKHMNQISCQAIMLSRCIFWVSVGDMTCPDAATFNFSCLFR
jgi:hypothetical protein